MYIQCIKYMYIYDYLQCISRFLFFFVVATSSCIVYNNPRIHTPPFILATAFFYLSLWVARYYLWIYVARANAQSFFFSYITCLNVHTYHNIIRT